MKMPAPRSLAGFTLVELLVGLVIALMGSIAIMQTFTTREEDRRTIGALSDTNNNANLAMFLLERDLQQAAAGFSNLAMLGCTMVSTTTFNNQPLVPVGLVPAGAASNDWNLPNGDAGSDMVVVMYGTSDNTSEGLSLTRTAAIGDSMVSVSGVSGLNNNNLVVIGQTGQSCTVTRVASTNPIQNEVNLGSPLGRAYSNAGRLYNLGSSPRFVAYAVRDGNLTVCDMIANDCSTGSDDPTVWVPMVNNIAGIVVHRGVDTTEDKPASDGFVDRYCADYSGNKCGGATTMTACDHARSLSIRFAVVTRSPEQARQNVSTATLTLWPDSASSPFTTGPVWNVPDRTYRYRIATTNVTLRNIQLMGAQSGC